jgi:F-type H+-transporting ATPase subunit alpha
MKKVAGTLRLELAQFRELAAFAQFGQDLDESTKKKIERGRRLTELLKQPELSSIPFEEQVVAIYSATGGFMDNVAVGEVKTFETNLIKFLKERYSSVLKEILESTELKPETEKSLKEACADFANNYWRKV